MSDPITFEHGGNRIRFNQQNGMFEVDFENQTREYESLVKAREAIDRAAAVKAKSERVKLAIPGFVREYPRFSRMAAPTIRKITITGIHAGNGRNGNLLTTPPIGSGDYSGSVYFDLPVIRRMLAQLDRLREEAIEVEKKLSDLSPVSRGVNIHSDEQYAACIADLNRAWEAAQKANAEA